MDRGCNTNNIFSVLFEGTPVDTGHQLQQLKTRKPTDQKPLCPQSATRFILNKRFAFSKDPRGRPSRLEWTSSARAQHLRVTVGNSPRASWKITSLVWLFGEEVPTTGDRLNSGIPERIQAIHTATKASDSALLVPSLGWAAGWWSLLRLPHLPVNSGPASPGKAPRCPRSCYQASSALNISPSGSQPYQFCFLPFGSKDPIRGAYLLFSWLIQPQQGHSLQKCSGIKHICSLDAEWAIQ